MQKLMITSVLLFCFYPCAAQTATRITKASRIFDVWVDPVQCDQDKTRGPIKVTLYKKRSPQPFQEMVAGRINGDWLSDSIQFIDINFDGVKDLLVFDGLTAPGGNGTLSRRIYLYSKKDRQFVFNAALSELSHRESFLLESRDLRKRQIVTYARPGGGFYQNRWYRIVNDRPQMFREATSDETYMNGSWTLETTRTLVNGKWVVRKKRTKDHF